MDEYKKKPKNKKSKSISGNNLLDISEKITDNSHSINQILCQDNEDKPDYLSQFSPQRFDSGGVPSAPNDIHQTNDKSKLADLERQLSYQGGWSQYDDGSMSYGIYQDNQLVHNNMVPYFSLKYGYGSNDLYNESVKNYKNELFTGNLKNIWKKKQENSPLFSPMANLSFVYGTPVRSNDETDRYIPSRYRQNEKLFEEEWVTPGVNLEAHEVGTHGYHSLYRPMDKTVDELRVKPKITYEGRMVEGMHGQARPIQAPVISYRPDTFKTTTKKDLLPTGTMDGPKTRDNFIMKETDRIKQHFEYTGGAYNNQEIVNKNVPEYMREKYKYAQKQNFKHPKPLQKFSKDQTHFNSNLPSYNLPFTTRDQTTDNNYIGVIGNVPGSNIYTNLMDVTKTTTKEITTDNPQTHTYVSPNTMRGTVQPMDVTNTTIKEMTVENKLNPYVASLNTMQRIYHSDTAKTTTKETTMESILPSNAGQDNNIYTNWSDIAKQTTKETTIQIPYQTTITPVHQQQRAPNLHDVAKMTTKESTVQIPHQTFVTPIYQQQRASNPQDTTRPTIKESTVQIPYHTIMTPIGQQQMATNLQDTIRTTTRETTNQIPYQTIVTPINQNQTTTHPQDMTRTTNKEITSQTPWNNFVTPIDQQQRASNPQDVSRITMKETTVQTPWNNFITPTNQQRGCHSQDVARTTTKEATIQIPYQTFVTSVGQQQRTPNLQDGVRTTTKESTIVIPYHTNIKAVDQNQGNASSFDRTPLRTTNKEQTVLIPYQSQVTAIAQQQRAPNPQDVAKTTIKEQFVQIPYNTHIIAVNQQQRMPDLQDLPRTTTKEQTIQIPYNTHTTAINQNKGKVNAFDRTPLKTTIKETIIYDDHIGMPSKDTNGKGYGYIAEKMEAPNTNRQFTGQEVYITPLEGQSKNRPYDDAYHAETNDRKEKLQIYHPPTNSNINLGPDPANIVIHMSNDDNQMPEPMVGYSANNQLDRPRTGISIKPIGTMNSDRYLDNMLLKQLENNPYHIQYFN